MTQSEVWARHAARRLLSNRKGHGGGPCSYRQLNEAQLIAFAQVAYERGVHDALAIKGGRG